MKIRTLTVLATLLEAVVSVQFTKEYSQDKDLSAWLAAKQHLNDAHDAMTGAFAQPYNHLIDMNEEEEGHAWRYSQEAGNGPFYFTGKRNDRKYVYILTKVPGTSELGRRWGLDDQQPTKNAFLFWKVKAKDKKAKLLGFEFRAAGAPTLPSKTLDEVIQSAKQARNVA
ncbi:conserved hypothetical Ustilago-specific protein [Sporisorium reilianum SRZ2]|uniref:Conserved hypothetical Ustilago-specific protein n=1 Tax=Sporisorium reilianum (strain SRZ2) TaxID=999809 RepID=E6ZZZ1_SPORE|nr:conserved hypothetical Ustilago-specific protein [Sporisorium reilianum SRZ2]